MKQITISIPTLSDLKSFGSDLRRFATTLCVGVKHLPNIPRYVKMGISADPASKYTMKMIDSKTFLVNKSEHSERVFRAFLADQGNNEYEVDDTVDTLKAEYAEEQSNINKE